MLNGLPHSWGATVDDVERAYPADHVLPPPVTVLNRAVAVQAPAELAYRWLCQISVAPYSYDLLDNLGRRSPRQLTPGVDQLVVGQEALIFEVTDVQPARQWSGRCRPPYTMAFGDLAVTFAAEPDGADRCRMVCRLVVRHVGVLETARARFLAWGDLVMMRKQLLTLKALAERDARLGV